MATTTTDPTTTRAGVDGADASPRTRIIEPVRRLASTRAVVGALLVTAAMAGAYWYARPVAEGPTSTYVVAIEALSAGEVVDAGAVTLEALELSDLVAEGALRSTAGLDGAVARRDLRPGDLVDRDDLLEAPGIDLDSAAVHELAFPIPAHRSPPVVPGDRVTILATIGSADRAVTLVAVEDAPVLSVERDDDRLGGDGGVLTLALDDPADVVAMAHLGHAAELTVVRSTRALDDRYPATFALPDETDTADDAVGPAGRADLDTVVEGETP